MNKEEMFKNLSDKDKKEVLNLMSFMKKIKEQDRKKELYATYEEYLDLIHISEHLSNENELLQSQLDIANKKLEELKKYIQSKIIIDYDEQDCCVEAIDEYCVELLDFIELLKKEVKNNDRRYKERNRNSKGI